MFDNLGYNEREDDDFDDDADSQDDTSDEDDNEELTASPPEIMAADAEIAPPKTPPWEIPIDEDLYPDLIERSERTYFRSAHRGFRWACMTSGGRFYAVHLALKKCLEVRDALTNGQDTPFEVLAESVWIAEQAIRVFHSEQRSDPESSAPLFAALTELLQMCPAEAPNSKREPRDE